MKIIILAFFSSFFLLSALGVVAQIISPKKVLEKKAPERIDKAIDQQADQA